MPLYEYECEKCGHRFETIQKFSDPPRETCPKCGGHVHKLIAAPAFQFKGSGWYITDYAKKDSSSEGSGSAAKSEKPADTSAKTETTTTSKSDSKSESKSESKSDSKSEDSKPKTSSDKSST